MVNRTPTRRVGIVVVHGVTPQPRYQMQDSAAQQLARELNEHCAPPTGGQWVTTVLNPRTTLSVAPSPPPSYEPRSTITRVRLMGPAGYVPSDIYDVVEAYWSPLDKGKTNAPSVLWWLLSTIFVPANTTARYMASWQKTCFDIGYVIAGAAAAVGALLLAFWIALLTFQNIIVIAGTGTDATQAAGLSALWDVLANPAQIGHALSFPAVALLACAVFGGFILMQAVRAIISVLRQKEQLKAIPVQFYSRVIFIGILLAISIAALSAAAYVPLPQSNPTLPPRSMGLFAIGFALAALAFEAGKAGLESFIVAFFGDVQIYTTEDENSDFFKMRESILDVAASTIGDMTSAGAFDGNSPYDRVHVLAHSLGSTIAMDSLIRLYNLKEQGEYSETDFARIRSFVTFGSPLEKTKYFFDIADPSQSLSYVQWRNDAYGVLFSDSAIALNFPNGSNEGIFWANYWYFKDPIANEIDSYRSFLVPGDALGESTLIRERVKASTAANSSVAVGRQICRNRCKPGVIDVFRGRLIPHGDYLNDPWFWHVTGDFMTLDVVTSSDSQIPPPSIFGTLRANGTGSSPSPSSGPSPSRYEMMTAKDARWHRDTYP